MQIRLNFSFFPHLFLSSILKNTSFTFLFLFFRFFPFLYFSPHSHFLFPSLFLPFRIYPFIPFPRGIEQSYQTYDWTYNPASFMYVPTRKHQRTIIMVQNSLTLRHRIINFPQALQRARKRMSAAEGASTASSVEQAYGWAVWSKLIGEQCK